MPWAVSYALLPFFLSYGGWGRGPFGAPPTPAMVGLWALLGIGVHFLTAAPGLVADNAEGTCHLPLRVALRTGAPRLLALTATYVGLVLVGMVVVGATTGLQAD